MNSGYQKIVSNDGKQLSDDFKHEIEEQLEMLYLLAMSKMGIVEKYGCENHLYGQSPDIAMGVDAADNKEEEQVTRE